MAEMTQNMYMYSWSRRLMPSHPGPQQQQAGGLIQISLWTRHVLQNKNVALMQSLLVKPPEVRHCEEAYINRETDISTCSYIAEIHIQAFCFQWRM